MTMASQGQPSRKQPSGPLLRHFLQPMQRMGSIWMRPNGGLSSSGTQNMQSSTGQYSTHAGEPAQPVQHSVITASSLGFFLRAVSRPLDLGSCLNSSGTIPTIPLSGSSGITRIIPKRRRTSGNPLTVALFIRHIALPGFWYSGVPAPEIPFYFSRLPGLNTQTKGAEGAAFMAGKSLNRVTLIGNL